MDSNLNTLPHVNSYCELVVYQKSRDLAGRVFALTRQFPRDEVYSLTDQIRRSSRSVGAQIAEAWGKRRYPRHFVSKLSDADAEQLETQHWVTVACDCGYLAPEIAGELAERLNEIGRMLYSMQQKAQMFCGPSDGSLREAEDIYFVEGVTPKDYATDD